MSKTARFAIGGIVVLGLAFGLFWSQLPASLPPPGGSATMKRIRVPDEGDRPPIIISDGSVDIYVDPIGYSDLGTWNSADGGKTWILTPGTDYNGNPDTRPVLSFTVRTINVKKDSDPKCKDLTNGFSVSTFEVNFKNAGFPAGNAIVDIVPSGGDAGKARVAFGGKADRDPDNLFWLDTKGFLNGQKLRSATFGDVSCEFAGPHRGIVRVVPIVQ